MLKMLYFPRHFSLPCAIDLFTPLLFLYFVTLHADALSIRIGYTFRINNFWALALVLVLMVRLRKDFFKIERWLAISLALVALSLFLSFAFSPFRKQCAPFLCWFGLTFLCYFWMPYQIMAKLEQDKILKFYFASFIVVGAYATLQFISGPLGFLDPFAQQRLIPGLVVRPNALCYEPSYYNLYMTPFIAVLTVLYLSGKHNWRFWQMGVLNLFFLISFSAGAVFSYITLFALLFCYSTYRQKSVRFLFKLLLVVCPFIVLAFPLLMRFMLKFFLLGSSHGSFSERFEGIIHCLKLFLQRPLFGYGLGAVPFARMEEGLIPSNLMEIERLDWRRFLEATNITTEIMASLGTFGLIAFGLMIALYTARHLKVRTSPLQEAFFISVLVMVVTWQFSQSLLRTYTWTHFALACALLQTSRPSLRAPLSKEFADSQDKLL